MSTAQDYLSNPELGLVREVRQSQLTMAKGVERVVADGGLYLVEGPVGVGKTFAYLTPAILSGKRIVIATPKKSLQDQIIQKDLPAISKALKVPFKSVVIKGRANYTCQMLAQQQHLDDSAYLQFAQKSHHGDQASFPGKVPKLWFLATAEHCIGRSCNFAGRCGYIRLRNEVQDARVVVINHHLLGSDFYFGHGSMTGGPYDVLIVDEAHKLAEGIRSAFTHNLSETSAKKVFDTLQANHFATSIPAAGTLNAVWSQMFSRLPNRHWKEAHKRPPPVFPEMAAEAESHLARVDAEVGYVLKAYGCQGDANDPNFWNGDDNELRQHLVTLSYVRRTLASLTEGLAVMQGRAAPNITANTVVYAERSDTGPLTVKAAPILLAGIIKPRLDEVRSTILTSATLAINGRFNHLSQVVGKRPVLEDVLPTSFDYAKAGYLYIPRDIFPVERKAAGYDAYLTRLINECAPLIEASQGGAMVLMTAEDEMRHVAEGIEARCRSMNVVVHKRDGEPQQVLSRFLATKRSVLFGLKSFWEGIDIPGPALRLVIIPKLPFPPLNDPIVEARRSLYDDSMQAFVSVNLVDMVTDLRQGVGRLIRSLQDRGVVAILDSRLWTKTYAPSTIKALQFPKIKYLPTDILFYLSSVVTHFQDSIL